MATEWCLLVLFPPHPPPPVLVQAELAFAGVAVSFQLPPRPGQRGLGIICALMNGDKQGEELGPLEAVNGTLV